MGYFSNSSEGMGYMEHYCCKCVNWRDNGSGQEGCQIIDLHSLWNYEQHKDKTKAAALEFFIPQNERGENEQCVMFQLPILPTQRELERAGQLRIDLQERLKDEKG